MIKALVLKHIMQCNSMIARWTNKPSSKAWWSYLIFMINMKKKRVG